LLGAEYQNFSGDFFAEKDNIPEIVISETAGIVKTYEAVTDYCGFSFIEAGKTMGLFPYGEHPKEVPALFTKGQTHPLSDRNVIVPTYPNGALVNRNYFEFLNPDLIILGKPLNMDGTPSEMMKKVDPFFKKLQKISSIPCELVDERLTSFEAKQLMHVDSKDDRIDDLAAKIFLDNWIEHHVNSN